MNDDFWKIPKRRFSFTERDIEVSLKRYESNFERGLRCATHYKNWQEKSVSLDTLIRMYGSFEKACKSFGIEIAGKKDEYSDDELIDFFEKLWIWRKQPPAITDFKKYRAENESNHISPDTYKRRFGDYREFVRTFSDFKLGVITKQDLLGLSRKSKRRLPISLKLRDEIFRIYKGRCAQCGKSANDGLRMEVDHIHPVNPLDKSRPGSNEVTNLQLLCELCNKGKSNKVS